MTAPPKLRLSVIGGGIGGLTLAVALCRFNLDSLLEIDIYEAAPTLTQFGGGITVWPRAWEIIQKLGLEDAFSTILTPGQQLPDGEPRRAFTFRKSDQKEGVPIGEIKFKGGSLSFHRADVQDVLLKHISPSIRFHQSCRLRSYTEVQHEIYLEFENGHKATCDLLIGADGIKSAVRKVFLTRNPSKEKEDPEPIWSGTFAYRYLIDSELLKQHLPKYHAFIDAAAPTVYCGKNKHVIVYPVSQGKFLNIVAFCSNPEEEGSKLDGSTIVDTTKDAIERQFVGWEEVVLFLISHMEKPSRWTIQSVGPLSRYAQGSVVLMGDAAHAMPPHQGQGAGQAIEDAYLLANILAKAVTTQPVESISIARLTEIYSTIRQPIGNFAQRSSREQGFIYELNGPGFEDVQEGDEVSSDKLEKMLQMIGKGWEWVSDSPMGDVSKALEMV